MPVRRPCSSAIHIVALSFDGNICIRHRSPLPYTLCCAAGSALTARTTTDDLAMQAVTDFTGDENAAVLAVQAGNDLIISSDFVTQYHAVLDAVKNGTLRKNDIEQAAQRVILWKIQLGLISF